MSIDGDRLREEELNVEIEAERIRKERLSELARSRALATLQMKVSM